MKKKITNFTYLTFLAAFILISCTKEDTTAPELKLNGAEVVEINLGDSFIDEGTTANDNKDGEISNNVIVTGKPANTQKVGEYKIEYNVYDNAGNKAKSVSRILRIKADKLAGAYNVVETYEGIDYTYVVNVLKTDTYNKLFIKNFHNFGDDQYVEVSVDTNNVIIQNKTFTGVKDHFHGGLVMYSYDVTGKSPSPYNGTTYSINTIKVFSKFIFIEGNSPVEWQYDMKLSKK